MYIKMPRRGAGVAKMLQRSVPGIGTDGENGNSHNRAKMVK